jgi:hypothetical protein
MFILLTMLSKFIADKIHFAYKICPPAGSLLSTSTHLLSSVNFFLSGARQRSRWE